MFSSNSSQVSSDANYVEDVFSTYLYTGNSSTQTINNGIDLTGKGGLVWVKDRSAVRSHCLSDTANGAGYNLFSDLTNGLSGPDPQRLASFNNNGFSIGSAGLVNTSGSNFSSWTFRKAAKFFDVVTYTGNGTVNRQIAHSLGSVPGCIIVKRLDTASDWPVYHRGLSGFSSFVMLNTTAQAATSSTIWNDVTSTIFQVNTYSGVNANGGTYVAYLFAHNAGGFGASGTDNVISCGSFTTDGSGAASVNLGYEPQWVMIKASSGTGSWVMFDNMRGFVAAPSTSSQYLLANASSAEGTIGAVMAPNATGFSLSGFAVSTTFIYIAIRRPNKPPTSGTQVFAPVAQYGGGTVTTGFPVDLALCAPNRSGSVSNRQAVDRLRGSSKTYSVYISPNTINAESSQTVGFGFDNNSGYADTWFGVETAYWNFKRAPGFFDVVCYTGTGSATTVAHNLGVVPELMIVKGRSLITVWSVYSAATGATKTMDISTTGAAQTLGAPWNSTAPTSSVFSVSSSGGVNGSGSAYVAYLFASCPGVSKVGSYTGNGTSQTINCGFAAGARFILIKCTSTTGDWYVWDSARGIVSGNDPHLSLNTTAAEVTTDDSIDPDSTGFIVNQVAATNINVNAATYIYLSIA